MKLCKDCKHFDPLLFGCKRDAKVCPLFGTKTAKRARFEREDGWLSAILIGSCGKSGRFWTPRNET